MEFMDFYHPSPTGGISVFSGIEIWCVTSGNTGGAPRSLKIRQPTGRDFIGALPDALAETNTVDGRIFERTRTQL